MRPLTSSLCCVLLGTPSVGAEQKAVVPASGPAPVGPYSPGVIADGYLYVSGQGAKAADGQMPATFEAQAQQTLENVKARSRGRRSDARSRRLHARLPGRHQQRCGARPRLRALFSEGSAGARDDRRRTAARHARGDQCGRRSQSGWANPGAPAGLGFGTAVFTGHTHTRSAVHFVAAGAHRERNHSERPGRRGRRRTRQLQGRDAKPPA